MATLQGVSNVKGNKFLKVLGIIIGVGLIIWGINWLMNRNKKPSSVGRYASSGDTTNLQTNPNMNFGEIIQSVTAQESSSSQ